LVTATGVAVTFALYHRQANRDLGQANRDLSEALDTVERNHREAELRAASVAVDLDSSTARIRKLNTACFG
jgi:hypothetical protein